MYRFLASKRWLVRTVAGLLLVAVCVRLGMWQLERNEIRAERNAVIEASTTIRPVPLDDVTTPGAEFDPADQWREVEITGRFDPDNELFLRLRPLDGQRGVHVMTPIITANGAALLVDRGFMPSVDDAPEVPEPPEGEVQTVVRLRVTEDHRDAGGTLDQGTIRTVNVEDITGAMPYQLYPAWAEATEPIGAGLRAIPPPEPDGGPHLSYAIQWFIFAVVGVVGFVLLVRAEAKGRADGSGDATTAGSTPREPPPLATRSTGPSGSAAREG